MVRSIIISLGIMAIVVGFECLAIDSATFYSGDTQAWSFFNPASYPSLGTRVWRPKDWLPWALLAAGTVTIMYTFALPRRFNPQRAEA